MKSVSVDHCWDMITGQNGKKHENPESELVSLDGSRKYGKIWFWMISVPIRRFRWLWDVAGPGHAAAVLKLRMTGIQNKLISCGQCDSTPWAIALGLMHPSMHPSHGNNALLSSHHHESEWEWLVWFPMDWWPSPIVNQIQALTVALIWLEIYHCYSPQYQ